MKLIKRLLDLLPADGYKTLLGYVIENGAVLFPQYQPLLELIGQVLFGVGLLHKGLKSN